jgi:hypothetical protein
MAVSLKENNWFLLWIKLHTLIWLGVNLPVLKPVHGMEYCVGLDKALNHWKNLAWPRFEPMSPKWHTSALSTTSWAHAHDLLFYKTISAWYFCAVSFYSAKPYNHRLAPETNLGQLSTYICKFVRRYNNWFSEDYTINTKVFILTRTLFPQFGHGVVSSWWTSWKNTKFIL